MPVIERYGVIHPQRTDLFRHEECWAHCRALVVLNRRDICRHVVGLPG